jgi:hypothetical protein
MYGACWHSVYNLTSNYNLRVPISFPLHPSCTTKPELIPSLISAGDSRLVLRDHQSYRLRTSELKENLNDK